MPKQGQYAKASRIKRTNDFKVKRQRQGEVINDDQLVDFLVIRYALTLKKRIKPRAQETVQRFLIEIGEQLIPSNGDLKALIPPVLNKLNSRVPWQFYWQISTTWELLQHFLQRELPAVPLRHRLRLVTTVSTDEFQELIAELLAQKVAAITFINQPKAPQRIQEQLTKQLLQTIYLDSQIDWDKVRALMAPIAFPIATDLDATSKKWLQELAAE